MHVRSRSLALIVCLMAAFSAAQAATVQGKITDPLGAAIAGARVVLLTQNGTAAETKTDSAGKYELAAAKPGRFRLRAAASGFAAAESDWFYAGAGETVSRDLFLKIKSRSEEVVVTATGVPISEAQEGASIAVLTAPDFLVRLDAMDPLPAIPGVQVSQSGERGGQASLFIRGGNANSNKVLVDGVPVNDIGGTLDLSTLSLTGIDHIEVFRGPNSVLYGSDALAGVVSMETPRGTTPVPEFSYALDGGNFQTYQQQGKLAGAWRRFDYFADLGRFDSSNTVPNSRFHNGTLATNLGWSPAAGNNFRVTVRRVAIGLGSPNAIELFGLPDTSQTATHDTFISATYENQATSRWHNLIRYGASRLDSHFDTPSPAGVTTDGFTFTGLPVTIRGANGFTVSGQAFLTTADCCPSASIHTANRDFVYAQTDYRFSSHFIGLLGYRYEAERGDSQFTSPGFSSGDSADRRNHDFIVEAHGDLRNRLFYSLGGGVDRNAVFGTAATPRVSLAYYLLRPADGLFRGTKLKFNFGKGIKEPTIFDETSSLFDLLQQQPGGDQLIQQFRIRPVRAERSRSYDFGLLQSFTDRFLAEITLFHNQFYDQIEFLSTDALQTLGVPSNVINAAGFGATVNTLNYLARGVETELQFRVSNSLQARGGYTYLDSRVQRSFSGDALAPSINPGFPDVPIGAFSPLIGARPFRRAPHTGFLSVTYTRPRWSALLQGIFVGRRDDSTFLLDSNFGNTLLLPNRNLDAAYHKLDFSGDFRLNRHLLLFASMENLLNEHYDSNFGFPALPFTFRSGVKITVGGGR
ncbi:MAG TPA: TonB-dependent receptor [Candidatus Angelobacter sp.]|nr:TonB-dependent receptor [Candidatus Angelobacter sp.]